MSLGKVGALYVVTCSAWTLGQFHLHLEVFISDFKFLPFLYVYRALVSNVLRLFY